VTPTAYSRASMPLPTGPAVTFLFTDIEGSTRLERAVGSETWAGVVAEHDRRLRTAIEGAGGHVVKTEGDAVFAAFGAPDAALQGIAEAQRALAGDPLVPDQEVRVRAGLHLGTGRVRTDLAPGAPPDYVGIDVNYAARIAAAANGGQIVVSDALVGAIGGPAAAPGGARLVDEGLRIVKDFDEPARLFRLVVPGAADDDRPLRTLDAPSNLPQAATALIGREDEVEQVATALGEQRLVTLSGPGGSGKTRLALGVAERVRPHFAHGTWFVDLANVRDPAQVEPMIAATIGVRTPSGGSVPETLAAWLRDRETLLVLDNLEQLLPGAAQSIAQLIRGAAGLRILVTSRELLRIGGELGHQVPPLEVSAGARLFEDRARLHRPNLVLDEGTHETILEISRRLDGLPLAIELAAARIRVLSPAAILERLGRSLDLGGGERDLPERQRTLRAAIDWSHELLTEPERRLFRRLSVFAGGFDGETAFAVADPEGALGGDALDLLESLLDKSLIRREIDASGAAASDAARFSLHVLIREYAQDRLEESGERAIVEARHAAAMRAVARQVGGAILTAAGEQAMARLDREQHNLRAAMEWSLRSGDVETGLAIAGPTWRWYQQRGRLDEGRAVLARLFAQANAAAAANVDPAVRLEALSADGGLAYWQGAFDEARALYEERIALAETSGEARQLAEAHYDLGFIFSVAEDAEGIRGHEQQALELFTKVRDPLGIEKARQALSLASFLGGDYQTARQFSEDNIEAYRAMGSYTLVADSLTLLSAISWRLDDPVATWEHMLEGLRLFVERDLVSGLARALGMAAIIELRWGDAAFGARIAGATAELQRVKGVMIAPARVLHLPDPVAYAHLILGDEAAAQLLAEGAATPSTQMAELILDSHAPAAGSIDRERSPHGAAAH
jgi:predicted ATPase/class 3 adenylate cyclase